MTAAERLLLLLVADAMIGGPFWAPPSTAIREKLRQAREAIDAEAFAESARQGTTHSGFKP